MATLWNKQRKVAFFIFLTFSSLFVSLQLFSVLSSMLGAVMLGFLINKRWLELTVVLAGYIGIVSYVNLVAINVFFPLVFLAMTYLINSLFKNIDKGALFFLVTVVLSLFFLLVVGVMEIKSGYVSQILSATKAEMTQMTEVFKQVMTPKEISEYLAYAQSLLERYHIFFALLQIVFFTFLNLALLPYLFDTLPVTLSESFYKMKIPYYGIWGINFGLILYLFKTGTIAIYGINAVLFFLSIYFIQGLSLFTAFFRKYGIPFYISLLFFTMFLINQAMWLLLSIAGIVDSQFNIKKYLKEA